MLAYISLWLHFQHLYAEEALWLPLESQLIGPPLPPTLHPRCSRNTRGDTYVHFAISRWTHGTLGIHMDVFNTKWKPASCSCCCLLCLYSTYMPHWTYPLSRPCCIICTLICWWDFAVSSWIVGCIIGEAGWLLVVQTWVTVLCHSGWSVPFYSRTLVWYQCGAMVQTQYSVLCKSCYSCYKWPHSMVGWKAIRHRYLLKYGNNGA